MPLATDKVLVNTIGVSISPSSATWLKPADFPNPLNTNTAAGTLF
jgi:hypothetical protein